MSSFCHRRALGIYGGSPRPYFEIINDYSFTAKTASLARARKIQKNIGLFKVDGGRLTCCLVDNLKPIIEINAICLELLLHTDHPTLEIGRRPTQAIHNHRAINCLIQRLSVLKDQHLEAHSKKLIKVP